MSGRTLEPVSLEATSKSSEGGSGGRESNVAEPDAVDLCSGAKHDLDGQLSALKVTGTDCDLNAIGVGHVAVDEDSHHGLVIRSEGLLEGSRDFGSVAQDIEVPGSEVAELHLTSGGGPEVEAHFGPTRCGVGEGEDDD